MPDPIDTFISKASKRLERKTKRLEKEDEDDFEDWCKTKGIWCIKLVFLFGKGWPDRTLLCPGGRIIFIEMKRAHRRNHKDGGLSKWQVKVKNKIIALGFPYHIGYGVNDAKRKVCKELNLKSGSRGAIK